MKYEVNGRNDFEKNSLDTGDLQVTGLATNHVEIESHESRQKVVYSLGATVAFPAGWSDLGPKEKRVVSLQGETQINFRKKVFYRNVLRNEDQSLRLNDVTATVSVTGVDLHA